MLKINEKAVNLFALKIYSNSNIFRLRINEKKNENIWLI